MVFLTPYKEIELKRRLALFLKKKYNSSLKLNYPIFNNFAPDYHLKQKNGKERIVIFRNPPSFPSIMEDNINLALQNGVGVYIATYNYELSPLLQSLLLKCDKYGAGVIQCSNKHTFQVLQPSVSDYPRSDKIIEGRIKFFISSKLWIQEREIMRKILIRYKHQPICVERLLNQEPLEQACYNRIDESRFFIGIITSQYRSLVDNEIRYAIKKKKKNCIIYIKSDCFYENKKKLKKLIDHVKNKKIYQKFSHYKELGKIVPNQIAGLVASHTTT